MGRGNSDWERHHFLYKSLKERKNTHSQNPHQLGPKGEKLRLIHLKGKNTRRPCKFIRKG